MASAVETVAEKKDKRPSTAHLKVVPEARELRDRVRAEAARFGQSLDRSKPLTKQGLQQMAEGLLRHMGLGEEYLVRLVRTFERRWRAAEEARAAAPPPPPEGGPS